MQNNLLKKSLVIGIIVLFIGSNAVSSLDIQLKNTTNPLINSCGNTLYVGGYGPDNYTKIQDAIDNASDGDTIFVYNGIYYKDEINDYKTNIDKDINIIEIDACKQVISNNFNVIIDAIRFFKIERNKICVNTFFKIINNIIAIMTYRQKTYHSMHILRNLNPLPTNKAIDQPTNPIMSIKVNDNKGHKINVTFRTNASGTWEEIGSNNSVGNGTYSQIPSNMHNYNTKYWWSVNTSCSEGVWDNDTYCFTTSAIKTSVNVIIPYNQTISPLDITANGPIDLSNVSLYYRYDKNNFTYIDYITSVTESDVFKDGIDSNYMEYPNQMIVRDGIAYIVAYKDDSIVIVNVTNSSNLVEISHLQSRVYLNDVHDIDITNDSKYAYTISMDSPYLNMFNITNKTSIIRLNQKYLTGEKGMYLDLDDDNNFLYVTTKTKIRIYNVTNKKNYQLDLVSSTNVGLDNNSMFWHPNIYKDVLYVTEMNTSITNQAGVNVYNVSNKSNPVYVQNISSTIRAPDQLVFKHSNGCVYLAIVGEWQKGGYTNGSLIMYNISSGNASNPTYMYQLNITDSNFTFPYYGFDIAHDYAFISKNNYTKSTEGFWVYSLENVENPEFVTDMTGGDAPTYLSCMHEIEFDENRSNKDAVYFLAECPDALISVSLTWEKFAKINLSNSSLLFSVDPTYPWNWSFNFLNGTGYYEFYSIGKKIGNIDESSPHIPDTSCHFISTYINTITPLRRDKS